VNGNADYVVMDGYDPSKAPPLYLPAFASTGKRAARNPLTGAPVPAVLIGAFVPRVGDPINNGVAASNNPNYPHGFRNPPTAQFAPRLKFAYDVDGNLRTYQKIRSWSYGSSGFDQAHVFVANYSWDLQHASRLWKNVTVCQTFDNWELSGVTSFSSGFSLGVGYSTTDGAEITGGGDGDRIIVTGKARLPFGDRSFPQFFSTAVFACSPKGSLGNATKDIFRGPGINDWDRLMFRNFPLASGRRIVQFRAEAYNAFNHTQFNGVNTTARFDPTGAQVNAKFGQLTSTRSPRITQLSLGRGSRRWLFLSKFPVPDSFSGPTPFLCELSL